MGAKDCFDKLSRVCYPIDIFLGVDIVDSFHIAYESVADFEAKHGVEMIE